MDTEIDGIAKRYNRDMCFVQGRLKMSIILSQCTKQITNHRRPEQMEVIEESTFNIIIDAHSSFNLGAKTPRHNKAFAIMLD